ncbi:hypothetical protein HK100_005116 [Physocladia obscura]|uniref:Uncharacterized protein n=1 Tax=Physocladia obscura TaxID=109957 RepID=A0AAD5XDG2_9FUNG|nr:hypothetical protein HK100_005116 [Physocladia obscura]
MNTEMNDNETRTALYKVSFLKNNEEESMDLILDVMNKNRNHVRKIISNLEQISVRSIKNVKFKFRKYIVGYQAGYEKEKG